MVRDALKSAKKGHCHCRHCIHAVAFAKGTPLVSPRPVGALRPGLLPLTNFSGLASGLEVACFTGRTRWHCYSIAYPLSCNPFGLKAAAGSHEVC